MIEVTFEDGTVGYRAGSEAMFSIEADWFAEAAEEAAAKADAASSSWAKVTEADVDALAALMGEG